MGTRAAILMFLSLFIYFQIPHISAASLNRSNIDESSLLAIKSHINSDILARNWTQETSFCSWIGVVCSRNHLQRVSALNLSNMGLQGSIAPEIGNLSFLAFLDISNNSFSGAIPAEIGNLRRLRVLNTRRNQLSGRLPERLGLMTKLQELRLSGNYLIGDIPASLSACVELNTLHISSNNLTGNIPVGFGNLSQLRFLSLARNQLTGEFPSTIFNISSLLAVELGDNQLSGSLPKHIFTQSTKLQVLELYSNQFEGEILPSLMACHSLRRLILQGNKFTGNIPREIMNLSFIQEVYLGSNHFAGAIPTSIGNLSNLEAFDISENEFDGGVPSEIGQLSRLTWFNLGLNNLNGEMPQSIFNLSNVQTFSLNLNNLSGSLPFSLDKDLPNMERLYLAGNHFYGNIPNSLTNMSKITTLELSWNSFTGHIPISLGNLRGLTYLNMGHNQLSSNMSKPEQDFLTSLTDCKFLKILDVSVNPITGVLPKSLGFGNLSVSLELFYVEYCQIISPLPSEIGNLSNLVWLGLQYNDFTGDVPATFGNLRSLQNLEIQGNKFEGSISHVLCNLTNLYSASLGENSFSGPLPMCLGSLSQLRNINLSYNAFSSNIPSTFWLNGLLQKVDFSNNFLDGSLSSNVSNMKSLIELDLSGNQLSGEIPATITQLQNLINLSLSYNKFNGPLSASFANLKDLQNLDLSHNNLTGPIPKSFEGLPYLKYFNVSFNELSGEIPDEGPFLNYTAESFKGNRGLCGAARFNVEACETNVPANNSSKNRSLKLIKIILPLTCSSVVAALIVILTLRQRRKLLLPSYKSDLPHGVMHQRITYQEILRATSNLDEENLIGRGGYGSVYKGNFSDGSFAAVKVFNLDVQGAFKSFDTECEVMRSLRHRNLVKVVTSCSNLDFKALVMEYMPQGNLENVLYSEDCFLNISQLLGIMIDVASALKYLHEGYSFPIVHCDLKPSNILLDEDMVAHVGDFGIAKLLTEEQRMHQTRTLGTIGYMAPEYGSEGFITTMVDVYSFGILLMETISRRKPTDEMFREELSMRQWMLESFPNSIEQVVDNKLLNMDDDSSSNKIRTNCLTSIIELALDCTAEIPEKRPSIKDVLVKIEKMKLNLSNHK